MISYDFLESIANRLKAYRNEGRGDIIYDGRDRGNYGDYDTSSVDNLLKRADPTGFAQAMLINEKIEATIDGSKVFLHRVLREEGFIERLKEILVIKEDLNQVLGGPLSVFQDRIEQLIGQISSDFGKPTTREIAVCMRDAVYCIEKGMKIRWLKCDEIEKDHSVGLMPDICERETLADFVYDLKTTMPFGVCLAKIGSSQTAIGIKKPGRIAYLSSLSISIHTGSMEEVRTSDRHMRENLDLQGFSDRYPDWFVANKDSRGFLRSSGPELVPANLLQIKDLSRDTVIWLAMMIELAFQEMAKTAPDTIMLTESARMAIGNPSSISNLPVPYSPSWTVKKPKLADVYQSLELTDWEKEFLADALVGVNDETFIPVGSTRFALNLDTKALAPFVEKNMPSFELERFLKENVKLVAISEDVAGTEEEVHSAILEIYTRNLAGYLIAWGNRRFVQCWKDDTEWFQNLLAKNAKNALNADCVTVFRQGANSHAWNAASVYKQSPKHKTFRAICYFGGKGEADVKGLVSPKNAEQLVEVLGLKGISDLPEYLQRWSREEGWLTQDPYGNNKKSRPTDDRWIFSKAGNSGYAFYAGYIHFVSTSHPAGSKAHER